MVRRRRRNARDLAGRVVNGPPPGRGQDPRPSNHRTARRVGNPACPHPIILSRQPQPRLVGPRVLPPRTLSFVSPAPAAAGNRTFVFWSYSARAAEASQPGGPAECAGRSQGRSLHVSTWSTRKAGGRDHERGSPATKKQPVMSHTLSLSRIPAPCSHGLVSDRYPSWSSQSENTVDYYG